MFCNSFLDSFSFIPCFLQFSAGAESDISNAIKNGILYLEDSDHEWKPHFFMLTHSKMYYAEEQNSESVEDEEDNDEASSENREVECSEIYFSLLNHSEIF